MAFHTATPLRHTIERWYASPTGQKAQQARLALLRFLLNDWAGRSRSLLMLNPGDSCYLDLAHEAKFDLTVHEEDFILYQKLVEHKPSWCTLIHSTPEHMPFDDHSFDYALVLTGLEVWSSALPVLQELRRLASNGCIFLYANPLSLAALQGWYTHSHAMFQRPSTLCSTRTLKKMIHLTYSGYHLTGGSILHSPPSRWEHETSLPAPIETVLPYGAFAGLKVDVDPYSSCTPILISPKAVPLTK